jgi:hypothetical protein
MLRSRTLRPGNIVTTSLARNHQVRKPRWPLLKRHNASQGRVELSRGKSMAQFTTPRKTRRASYSIDGTRDVLHQRNNSAESLPSVHGKAKVEHHHNTAHQYAMQIEHDKLNNNRSVSKKKRTSSNNIKHMLSYNTRTEQPPLNRLRLIFIIPLSILPIDILIIKSIW